MTAVPVTAVPVTNSVPAVLVLTLPGQWEFREPASVALTPSAWRQAQTQRVGRASVTPVPSRSLTRCFTHAFWPLLLLQPQQGASSEVMKMQSGWGSVWGPHLRAGSRMRFSYEAQGAYLMLD